METYQTALMMEYIGWIFPCILIISGEHFEEEKLCDLPVIENGRIAPYYYSFKNYYFPMKKNGKLTYSCLAGFTTESGSQDEKINCTIRGWAPAPKCYKKCSTPPLDNGVFSNIKLSYKIWEILPYSCNSDYRTPGGNREETIQCLSNGWSAQPRCMETTANETCLAPELIHGRYHTAQRTFSLNEKVKYECDDGYRTAGGNSAEETLCHLQGWSLLPKCTKLECTALSSIEHGGFHPRKGSYEEGNVVQFFCLEGYSLEGPELIQCYYFGWYPAPPICEDRRNKCPHPPQPPNTKLLTNSTMHHHGDMVRLECEHPFQLRGAEEIRCENGKWTSPPKCIDESPRSTELLKLKEFLPHVPDEDRLASRNNNHSLENVDTCSSPPVVKNGFILGLSLTSYKTGSAVEYGCHLFHLLKGPSTVHCVQGRWTEPPICSEPCAVDEKNVSSHNIEMKWKLEMEEELYLLHGDMIEFVCKPGYFLPPSVGVSQLQVQCNNGKLKYPKCVSVDPRENCGSPPTIENGVVLGSTTTAYVHGLSVEYSCHENYLLQGSRIVSCSRGQWTTLPVCIEPCTLSEEEMTNNHLVLRWSYDNRPYFLHGEFVEFQCKPYHFSTSNSPSAFRVQCQNGQLQYPECVRRRKR